MQTLLPWLTFAASVASLLVSLITLYKTRLYVGKELAKGVRKLDL